MAAVPRFAVEERADLGSGRPGVVLDDRQTGAQARIEPAVGANLVGLRLAVRGQAIEVLTPEPSATEPAQSYGAPVLFPYPNRVRDGRYRWNGRTYQLPVTASGHAIHGLVIRRPFVIDELTADDSGAALRCSIRAADHPALAEVFPFAFRLTLTYRLSAGGLLTRAEVANEGAEAMPFGLGFHPFFRVPLAAAGRREACRLQLWAPDIWELDAATLATGQRLAVPPAVDVRGYPALGETVFDTLYTTIALDDPGTGTWSSRYLDPQAGIEVILVADAAYREAVLYAPTHRPVLSIEPYTCATNALNLQADGVDAGLLVLPPGERWTADYRMTARAITYAE